MANRTTNIVKYLNYLTRVSPRTNLLINPWFRHHTSKESCFLVCWISLFSNARQIWRKRRECSSKLYQSTEGHHTQSNAGNNDNYSPSIPWDTKLQKGKKSLEWKILKRKEKSTWIVFVALRRFDRFRFLTRTSFSLVESRLTFLGRRRLGSWVLLGLGFRDFLVRAWGLDARLALLFLQRVEILLLRGRDHPSQDVGICPVVQTWKIG